MSHTFNNRRTGCLKCNVSPTASVQPSVSDAATLVTFLSHHSCYSQPSKNSILVIQIRHVCIFVWSIAKYAIKICVLSSVRLKVSYYSLRSENHQKATRIAANFETFTQEVLILNNTELTNRCDYQS